MISIEAGKVFIGWIELPLKYLKQLAKAIYRWIGKKLDLKEPIQIGGKEEGVRIYSYDPLQSKEPVFVEADPRFSSFIVIEKISCEVKDLPNRVILNLKDAVRFLQKIASYLRQNLKQKSNYVDVTVLG